MAIVADTSLSRTNEKTGNMVKTVAYLQRNMIGAFKQGHLERQLYIIAFIIIITTRQVTRATYHV